MDSKKFHTLFYQNRTIGSVKLFEHSTVGYIPVDVFMYNNSLIPAYNR